MKVNLTYCHFKKLARSKFAMALPITFLILFVSTLGIVAFTYYFSVERISSQGQTLKVSTAKENLLSLDNEIVSTLGQPGSSSTFDLTDSGGRISIQPTKNVLTLIINDSQNIKTTIFNETIGKITYELPYSRTSETGLYLKGDGRTIINQRGDSTSQLCIAQGTENQEIQLHYRPIVTSVTAGLENGKTVNNIRIYVVNLNSSFDLALMGELPLQISCLNTKLTSQNYEVSYQPGSLLVTSVLDGVSGSISVPISSNTEGAIIHMETVISNVSIQRWIR